MANLKTLTPAEEVGYYADGFLAAIEMHKRWLISLASTKVVYMDPARRARFLYSPQAMLSEINAPVRWRAVILRVNGLDNPIDFDDTVTSLYVPNDDVLSRLYSMYLTISGRS